MERGDILLFCPNDFIGKIIKKVSKGKYSHSAIYLGGKEKNIIEISPLNMKVMSLSKKAKNQRKYDIFFPSTSQENIRIGLKFAIKELRKVKGYDWLNLFIFFFINTARKFNNKWFASSTYSICSEFVGKYLKACKIKYKEYKDIPEYTMSPSDLPKFFDITKRG